MKINVPDYIKYKLMTYRKVYEGVLQEKYGDSWEVGIPTDAEYNLLGCLNLLLEVILENCEKEGK